MLAIGHRYWLLIFFMYKEFLFFLLVISIPSYLSPLLSVFLYLLQRIVMGNLGYCRLYYLEILPFLFFFLAKCTITFQNTRYSISVILYFLSILPFWVISFAFFLSFSWVVSGLGWETGSMEKGFWVDLRVSVLGYWIKWNSEQIYIYWFL